MAETKGLRGAATRLTAFEVIKSDFPLILSGLGTVTPSKNAVVNARIASHLTDVNFS